MGLREKDARVLARSAFTEGVLYVHNKEEGQVMNINRTYSKLEGVVKERGEECGRQLYENKALNNLYARGYGRLDLPACLMPKTDEQRKSLQKAMEKSPAKDFGAGLVMLEPQAIEEWVKCVRMTANACGMASD